MRAAPCLVLVLVCALALAPDAAAATASALPALDVGLPEAAGYAAPVLAGLSLFAPERMLPLLEGDDGAGSGDPPAKPLTREQVQDMLRGRFGADVSPDMLSRLTELTMRAATAEAQRDALQGRLDAAKTPEGAVLLTGDEAAAYTALKGRDGFADAPLKVAAEKLDAGAEAVTKLATLDAQAVQDAAFEAAGLDPKLVRKYLPDLDARLVGEGDAAKAVRVTRDDKGAESTQPLDEYLAAEHEALVPVLSADGTAPAQRGGTATIPQRSASGQQPTKATDEDIQSSQRRALDFSL